MSKETEQPDFVSIEELQQVLASIREMQQKHGKEASLIGLPEMLKLAGHEEASEFPYKTLEDMAVHTEQQIETVSTLMKINLFNAKYASFGEEELTQERLLEFINDAHFIMPYIKKVYGTDSEEYQSVEPFAMLKDGIGEEEE